MKNKSDLTLDESAKVAREKYGLNEQQFAFCELYLENGNAQKSYSIAYETDNMNVAGVNGSKLKNNPKAAKYIADRSKEIDSQTTILSEQELKLFWSATVRNPNYKINDRMKASEYLAKNKGMLNDKIDITHDVEINLGFDLPELIENKIIDQKNKAIEEIVDEDYYTEFVEVEDDE